MKPIKELGISPCPWRVQHESGCDWSVVRDWHNGFVTDGTEDGFCAARDAHIIAAAPKMYEALREAVIEMCHLCESCSGHPEYKCENKESQCFVKKWRDVLAEASGEEVK